MAKFAIHRGHPHGDLQTSPQHAGPHELLAWFSLKRPQDHVERRVVGWSAGRHVDHPCGCQISPWLARKVTEVSLLRSLALRMSYKNNRLTLLLKKTKAFKQQKQSLLSVFSGKFLDKALAPHISTFLLHSSCFHPSTFLLDLLSLGPHKLMLFAPLVFKSH